MKKNWHFIEICLHIDRQKLIRSKSMYSCRIVFCLCSPLKCFIVSGLMFRSLIHFEFIFVYGIRKCSSFILFTSGWPVFPAPLVKEIVFSPLYILASLVKDKEHSFVSFGHSNQSRRRNKRNLNWKRRSKTVNVCRGHDHI